MQARLMRTIAPAGFPGVASGTVSMQTSPAPYMTVARMLLDLSVLRLRCRQVTAARGCRSLFRMKTSLELRGYRYCLDLSPGGNQQGARQRAPDTEQSDHHAHRRRRSVRQRAD